MSKVQLLDCLSAADLSYVNGVEVTYSQYQAETKDIRIDLADDTIGYAPMQEIILGVPLAGQASVQIRPLNAASESDTYPALMQFVKFQPLTEQDVLEYREKFHSEESA